MRIKARKVEVYELVHNDVSLGLFKCVGHWNGLTEMRSIDDKLKAIAELPDPMKGLLNTLTGELQDLELVKATPDLSAVIARAGAPTERRE